MTNDADVTVTVKSLADFETLKDRLADFGFARMPAPHRLRHHSGGLVDVLPFGPDIAPGGRLELEADVVLNIAGFEYVLPSAVAVGLIEGLAESTALIIKVFSGTLSDYLGKRKGLVVFGYALGTLTKPLFAIAPVIGVVLTARLLDRVGKGIRGAPRDALVADIAPAEVRGAAFGLRQSLDTVGAFLGPLLAVGLMLLWANDFRAVFWAAVIPGTMAVALLLFGLSEPEHHQTTKRTNPIQRKNLKRLGGSYWWVVGFGAVFAVARFSEAFLVLRAMQAGVPIALVPLVMSKANGPAAVSLRISETFRYSSAGSLFGTSRAETSLCISRRMRSTYW